MDRNYYTEYYDLERTHWWFLARGEILLSQIKRLFPNRNDLQILNVGAATGRSSELLAAFGSVRSLEFDETCIEEVKDRLAFKIYPGDITALSEPDNTYDLVCAFDVIEHVEADAKAIQELFRVCKPGGLVFVTVPAFPSLWSRHDEVNMHFSRYRSKILHALLPGNSEIIFSSYFNFWLFLPIWLFRQISNLFPKPKVVQDAGSDFSKLKYKTLNRVFKTIFVSENKLLKKGISLPFGVSLMLLGRKK